MTQQRHSNEGLTQREAMNILERDLATIHVINEMRCAFCSEDDPTMDYVYCETCRLNPSITGNRMLYYCSDCKAIARKKHLKLCGHNVNWRLVKRLSNNTLVLAKVSKNHSKQHEIMTQKSKNERDIENYNNARAWGQPLISIEQSVVVSLLIGTKEITQLTNVMSSAMVEFCKSGSRGLSVNSVKSLGKSLKQSGIIGKSARQWLKAGPIQLAICVGEIGVLFYQYSNGTIPNVKELIRRAGSSVLRNAGSWAGGYVGWNIGAILGSFGGPVGAVVGGAIGAILGGVGADKLIAWVFNKLFPPSDETIRQQALKDAVNYFHLDKTRLKDPNYFNEEKLRTLYKGFAKMYHPDVKGTGSHKEFIELSQHYATLLSIVNARNNKIVQKTIKAVA